MCKRVVEANGDAAGGPDRLQAASHGQLTPFCQLPCTEETEMFVCGVKTAHQFQGRLPAYFLKAAAFSPKKHRERFP